MKDHDNLWDRLSEQLAEKYPERDARGMAKTILVARGHLDQNGELTEEGKIRSAMKAEGRALDRAAKRNGGDVSDFEYDPETNKTRRF